MIYRIDQQFTVRRMIAKNICVSKVIQSLSKRKSLLGLGDCLENRASKDMDLDVVKYCFL